MNCAPFVFVRIRDITQVQIVEGLGLACKDQHSMCHQVSCWSGDARPVLDGICQVSWHGRLTISPATATEEDVPATNCDEGVA